MPVVEVVPHSLTEIEVENVAKVLLPNAVFFEQETDNNLKFSKAEIQDVINRWSEYANQEAYSQLVGIDEVDWSDEINALKSKIQKYSELLEKASEQNPHTVCEWTFKPENHYYSNRPYNNDIIQATTSLDGIDYVFNAVRRVKSDFIINGVTLSIGTNSFDRLIYRALMCRTEKPTSLQLNTAEQKAQRMLDQMNLGEWKVQNAVVEIEYCGEIPEYSILVNADLILEGISTLDGQRNPSLISEDTYSSNYYLTSAFFRFSPNGDLMYFGMDSPIDVDGVINDNVKTLPMEDLLGIAQDHLKLSDVYTNFGVPYGSVEECEEYSGEKLFGDVIISEVRYGLARIKIRNKDKNYYYVPAIALYGTVDYFGIQSGDFYIGSGQPYGDRVQAFVWVNAVDGSIIEN